MSQMLSVVNVFLASPSDVADERNVVAEIVAELNQSIAQDLGMMLSLVRWENFVPSIEINPQQVVNDQADIHESDIFVGILWNRFGTKTETADSGTEEEYEIAYSSWKKSRKPRIMFYFCERPSNFQSEKELLQKAKVIRFKNKLSQRGLIREYSGIDRFAVALRQDLTKHLIQLGRIAVHGDCDINMNSNNKYAGGNKNNHNSKPPTPGMIKITSGEFMFGRSNEVLTIDYEYYIDEAPVTNKEFVKFMVETGFMLRRPGLYMISIAEELKRASKTKPDHPVTMVTWYDAQAYANWIGKRLPSALEWERAARGVDGKAYPWGNTFDLKRCNSKESGIGATTPVHSYANGISDDGCYDMVGNVFEWVSDWVDKPRFSSAPNSEKANRGGSFNRTANDLICWYQESDPPDLRMSDVGFRCVWSIQNGT